MNAIQPETECLQPALKINTGPHFLLNCIEYNISYLQEIGWSTSSTVGSSWDVAIFISQLFAPALATPHSQDQIKSDDNRHYSDFSSHTIRPQL
jgi:hypothetical protein